MLLIIKSYEVGDIERPESGLSEIQFTCRTFPSNNNAGFVEVIFVGPIFLTVCTIHRIKTVLLPIRRIKWLPILKLDNFPDLLVFPKSFHSSPLIFFSAFALSASRDAISSMIAAGLR